MGLVHPEARLVDSVSGAVLGGNALAAQVEAAAAAYAHHPAGVVFARIPVAVDAITRYLGAWSAHRPVALLDPDLAPATLTDLIARYRPALVTGLDAAPAALPAKEPHGYRVATDPVLGPLWELEGSAGPAHHPDLGVLLATSGSTGSPKLVRLSRTAIATNATSIVEALGIDEEEIAPTSLPFFYSYGMSVLHSHLLAGASVLVEASGLLERPFWNALAAHGATSLAGVPYQYEMLRRLGFDPTRYPRLRTLTQAGGRLRTALVEEFHRRMAAVDGRLYVMYGQTEAGPRITTLPAHRLGDKLGSVGPAVPGGQLSVRPDEGEETATPGVTGEVIYRGANVMMGYAESAADLARGDELGGVLATGDLGQLDDDGYLYLSGRLKRIGKVFGVRLNLDEVEQMLRHRGPLAAVGGDDRMVVFAEGADAGMRRAIAGELAERLKLHRSGFDVRAIDALPLLPTGKIDYRALEKLA